MFFAKSKPFCFLAVILYSEGDREEEIDWSKQKRQSILQVFHQAESSPK